MKKLWIITFSLFLLGTPAIATEWYDEPESEMTATTMAVQGNRVHVSNGEGETLEIFNLTGVKVATVRIDSNDKTVTVNLTRGCYIMKVGKIVRKVTIR